MTKLLPANRVVVVAIQKVNECLRVVRGELKTCNVAKAVNELVAREVARAVDIHLVKDLATRQTLPLHGEEHFPRDLYVQGRRRGREGKRRRHT